MVFHRRKEVHVKVDTFRFGWQGLTNAHILTTSRICVHILICEQFLRKLTNSSAGRESIVSSLALSSNMQYSQLRNRIEEVPERPACYDQLTTHCRILYVRSAESSSCWSYPNCMYGRQPAKDADNGGTRPGQCSLLRRPLSR